MTRRGMKWALHSGFAVIAVPESGLYFRHGQLETGTGVPVTASDLILFARRADAYQHARQQEAQWLGGDKRGQEWFFPVISVLVSERA